MQKKRKANQNLKHLSSLSLSSLPLNDVGDDTGKHLQALWKLQGHCCKEKKKERREEQKKEQTEKLHICSRVVATYYLINPMTAQPYITPAAGSECTTD